MWLRTADNALRVVSVAGGTSRCGGMAEAEKKCFLGRGMVGNAVSGLGVGEY